MNNTGVNALREICSQRAERELRCSLPSPRGKGWVKAALQKRGSLIFLSASEHPGMAKIWLYMFVYVIPAFQRRESVLSHHRIRVLGIKHLW